MPDPREVWEIIDRRTGRRAISIAYPDRTSAANQIAAWNVKDATPESVLHLEPRPLRIHGGSSA